MSSAIRLQEMLLAKFGAAIGIYNTDNAYIGDAYDFSNKAVFYVGTTKDTLQGKDKNAYSVFADGKHVYLEGETELALDAAVSSFVHKWAHNNEGSTVRLSLASDAEIAAVAAPLVSLNMENLYDKQITYTSYDANGVYEIFNQKVAELPDEITVVRPYDEKNSIASSDITVFVSVKDGDDANKGTIDAPFKTIEKAIDVISYRGGGRILLREGIYEVKSTIQLNEAVSGTPNAPTFIGAYNGEKVTFTAGLNIDSSKAVSLQAAVSSGIVTQEMLARINCFDASNASKVYVVDMFALGYTEDDLGTVSADFYINNENYILARYPNAGVTDKNAGIHNGNIETYHKGGANDVVKVGNVSNVASSLYNNHKNETGGWVICFDETLYKDRLLSYKLSATDQLYTYGAVYQEWWRESRAITLSVDSQGRNLMTSASACQWGAIESDGVNLYFYNVPEELDVVGEYYIDRATGMLYFIPEHAPTASDEFILAAKSTRLINVDGAHDLIIDGLDMTKTLSQGIYVSESRNVIVQNCTASQVGAACVYLTNSPYSGVIDCEFRNTSTAVTVSCTNNGLTRESYNFVQNNYTEGSIEISGMHYVISHNYFDRTTMKASGFESVVEYNEFNKGSQTTYDSGPIYASGMAGRMALHVRYNSFHDLNFSKYGIYFDDLNTGNYIYGNIVEYAEENTGGNRGITIHGGAMNVMYNNIVVNAGTGIMLQITYAPGSINGQSTGGGGLGYRWPNMIPGIANTFKAMDKDVIAKRYPMFTQWIEWVVKDAEDIILREGYDQKNLLEVYQKEEVMIRSMPYNVMNSNIMIGCQTEVSKVYTLETAMYEKNKSYGTMESVGLTKGEDGKFKLASDSSIFTDVQGFKMIPFEKIGLLAD